MYKMSVQELTAKKVLLKSSNGDYLIPYTDESEKKAVWGNITGSISDQSDLNAIIAGGLRYKGEASSYAALPTEGNVVADVWRVLTACQSPKIPANGYVLWEGSSWGVLTGSGEGGSGSGTGFDWVGTQEEYNIAYEAGQIQASWICLIVDDNTEQGACAHIIDSYVNGTSGYRIWSDGYCEQWGQYANTTGDGLDSTTFLKTFADTNYILTVCPANSGNNIAAWTVSLGYYNKTATGFGTKSNGTYWTVTDWKACGYLAQGEY